MDFNSIAALMMYMGQLVSGLPTEEWAVFELAIDTDHIAPIKYTAYVDDKTLLSMVKAYFFPENIGRKLLVTGIFIESDEGMVLKVNDMKLMDSFLTEAEIISKRKRYVDFSED